MAIIWAIVLTLPSELTATELDAPIFAIHSRSAEMAISRPMIMNASIALTRPSWTRTIREPAHDQFIRYRVQKSAKGRRLVPFSGQITVDPVSNGSHDKYNACRQTLCIQGHPALGQVKNTDQQGHECHPYPGQENR